MWLALGWLLLIASAAHGYGDAIARGLQLRLTTRLERIAVTIGLGTGFLMVAMFVLGLLHLVGRVSGLVLVLPAAGFGVWRLVGASTATSRPVEAGARPRWLRRALLGILAACAAANLVGTLAPPSFVDALVYHLFIPRTYAQAGGIVEIPSIWQSYQPLGVEILFTLGFSLHGAVLAALMHTGLGILAAGVTCLLGRRVAGPIGGLLAAAIFYCTAIIAWESTSCFVELGITAFSALGLFALLRWADDENPRWLIVTAFFLGLSGSCKLTAIQFTLVAAALVAWVSWRRGRSLGAIVGRVAALVGISVGLCLPWYVHAYLWIGNPVYPFATRIFGDNVDYQNVWSILSGYGPGHSFKDLLLAPWRLFSAGARFEGGQYFSPLPFIFGPVILLRLWIDAPDADGAAGSSVRDRRLLFAAAAASFVLWLASAHIARYLIPSQTLVAVLAADAMCWVASTSRYRSRLVVAVGALGLGFGSLSALAGLKSLAPVVLGRESAEAYLARTAVFYTAYRMVMADVPENSLILTNLGPTYYLERPHVRVRNAEFLSGPERLAKVVAAAPYTHILVHGHAGLEEGVRALGPRVKLLWHRDVDSPLSRTFGGTARYPAALFEIVR